MRIILTLVIIASLSTAITAQEYKYMMDDPSVNFYDVVAAAEAYFAVNGTGKGSGHTPYMRWRTAKEPLYYPSGVRDGVDLAKITAISSQIRSKTKSTQRSSTTAEWTEIGPHRVDSITQHYAPGLGRVECVWADNNNGDTLYMSSRSGGWWRSYDSGTTWTNTTDDLPVTGVNVFSVRPDDDQDILINIRHAINGSTYGVYRSTDGGTTWSPTVFNTSTTGFGGLGDNTSVRELRHNHVHSDTVYVASSDGLWRSTDDMTTITEVFSGSINSIAPHPEDADVIHMTRNEGGQRNDIYRSTDGGTTWTISATIAANSNSTIKLHTLRGWPNMLIASSGSGVWLSEKDGNNFFNINVAGSSGSTFGVSDIDPQIMLRGVLDISRSSNLGSSWTQATEWYLPAATSTNYVHADFRSYYAINGVIYIGTDGYMCKTPDGGITWEILSEGTNIRENYKLGQSQSHQGIASCGSQDNGSSYYREGLWLEWIGADGMEQIIHPCNPDYAIGSIQNGNKRRSKDGAQTHTGINGHEDINPYWVAPLAYDPLDFGTIYALGDKLVRSDDWGDTWTSLHDFGAVINRFAIAENDNSIMIATDRDDIYKSTDSGATFVQIGQGLPNFFIADVAFDPMDDQTFALLYDQWQDNNQRIYLTQDGGATFDNISYNMSAIPGRSIVIDHTADRNIYVGTEVGVYTMPLSGTAYTALHSNLPPVAVQELEIHYGSNTIKAATWGRGLWEAPLIGRAAYPQITRVVSDINLAEKVNKGPQLTMTMSDGDAVTDLYVRYSINDLALDAIIDCQRLSADTYYATDILPATTTGDRVYYQVVAVGTAGDTTTSYRYMYAVDLSSDYCSAEGLSGTGSDYINAVSVNGIMHTSGKTQYSDFTAVVFDADQYDSVHVDVTLAAVFPPDLAGAWVDWNSDRTFGIDEAIDMGAFLGNTASGVIALPDYVEPGDYRLRVRVSYDAEVQPCSNAFGEVEDYTLRVAAACPAPAIVTTTDDGLPGSLRFWIDKTCVGDTIFFADDLLGDTLTIYNDPLSNTALLTIYGHDADNFTLSGDELRQIMLIDDPLNLVNVNLINANGQAPDGGSIINNSMLTLRRVTFENNKEALSIKPLTNNGTITVLPGISIVKE